MTENIIPDALPTLSAGSHHEVEGKACVMEYVALISGERWTDMPKCTLPMLSIAAQELNDSIDDDNQRSALLVPLIGRLLGSSGTGKFDLHQVQAQLAQYALGRIIRLETVYGAPGPSGVAQARRYAAQAVEVPDLSPATVQWLGEMDEADRAEWHRTLSRDTSAAQLVARHLIRWAIYVGGYGLAVAELSLLIDEYDTITDRHAHRPMTKAELVTAARRVEGR